MSKHQIKAKYDKIRYLPTIVGVITPLSILLCIPPLTGPWVGYQRFSSEKIHKDSVTTGLMGCAIACQLIATFALLARFWEKRIVLSTFISLFFFSAHACFTLGPIIHFWIYKYPSPDQKFTGDFMAGVATGAISIVSVTFLLIDYFTQDRLRKKGSGITNNQRTLVVFCIIVTIWSTVGAFVFSSYEGWTFTQGIYFTLVTMTTIGFGDLVPKLTGTRIFLFFYAIIGIVIMGIFINSIRIVILDGFEAAYLTKMEELERTYYENISHSENIGLLTAKEDPSSNEFEPEEATIIRKTYRKRLDESKWKLLVRQLQFSIISLIVFWFLGAVIFMLLEKWTYFDSVYFCFVSFTTVGYGDVTIKTFPGTVAFIGYALLGLVAAAYVISVGTEISSRSFDKRVEKIKLKHQKKTEEENELDEKKRLNHALEKIKELGDDKDGLIYELLALSKIYQRHIGKHLVDQEGLLPNELIHSDDFSELERCHILFCKLTRHLGSKVDPNLQNKYDTVVDRSLKGVPFNFSPSPTNVDSPGEVIELVKNSNV